MISECLGIYVNLGRGKWMHKPWILSFPNHKARLLTITGHFQFSFGAVLVLPNADLQLL